MSAEHTIRLHGDELIRVEISKVGCSCYLLVGLVSVWGHRALLAHQRGGPIRRFV